MHSFARFYLERYLLSRRRSWLRFDTLLTVLGVIISVAALIVTFAVFRGYETALKSSILGANSHVYLFHYGSGGVSQSDVDSLRVYFDSKPEVETLAGLVSTQAMVLEDERQLGVMLRGVDTHAEQLPTRYRDYIIEGRGELNRNDEAVLGVSLAQSLGLAIGDTVRVVSPLTGKPSMTRLFRLQESSFRIVGLYRSGMHEFDSRMIVTTPTAARPFSPEPDDFTWVELKLKPEFIDKADILAMRWERELGHRYQTHSWIFFNRELFALITLEKWILFIILSFLVLIASFNVASAVSTSILEHRREIGVMKTFGASNRALRQIFLGRSVAITALSVIAGELLGWILAQILTRQTIYQLKGDVYLLEHIYVRFDAQTWLLTFAVAMVIVTTASLWPLRRIGRLQLMDVMRNG